MAMTCTATYTQHGHTSAHHTGPLLGEIQNDSHVCTWSQMQGCSVQKPSHAHGLQQGLQCKAVMHSVPLEAFSNHTTSCLNNSSSCTGPLPTANCDMP